MRIFLLGVSFLIVGFFPAFAGCELNLPKSDWRVTGIAPHFTARCIQVSCHKRSYIKLAGAAPGKLKGWRDRTKAIKFGEKISAPMSGKKAGRLFTNTNEGTIVREVYYGESAIDGVILLVSNSIDKATSIKNINVARKSISCTGSY